MYKGEWQEFKLHTKQKTTTKEKVSTKNSRINMRHGDAEFVMYVHVKGSLILPGKLEFSTKPASAAAVITKLSWVVDFNVS